MSWEIFVSDYDDYDYGGGCEEAAEDAGIKQDCCWSCHGEWEYGYSTELELFNTETKKYYTVCCSISNDVVPIRIGK